MLEYSLILIVPMSLTNGTSWIDQPALEPAPSAASNIAEANAALFAEPMPALGGGHSYLRASAGLVTMTDSDGPSQDIEFNEGYMLALAFGQRMTAGRPSMNFDLELEAVWTDQDADDSGAIQSVNDVSFGGLFLNGTFDFALGERASWYIGAGIGGAWVDVGTQSDTLHNFDSDEGPYLAWQGKTGFEWRFSESTALNVGYRFINNDDVELDDDIGAADFDLQTEQHILEIGLRFGL